MQVQSHNCDLIKCYIIIYARYCSVCVCTAGCFLHREESVDTHTVCRKVFFFYLVQLVHLFMWLIRLLHNYK